ncbi:capping complex subunit for YIEGIA [Tepidibacter formicigenes]|jgi:hypothetical protein|uniref:Uncharacterized protein n=1 Tax=Tepidibacter formicigenes DSM 15518 TaxID=1123349 RepID=A0A1M6KDL0_9FIRM|nr:hypothetical protein [Tepidibacter formicigenes]SHJ57019.1 hypothetical protein SAMN02744037_00337 [Tepidibacter formicigenes DSM 15518]
MDVGINDFILAIVTTDKKMVSNTIPIFYVENREELERRSLIISKCMMGMVHDVQNDTFIIVKH